MIKLKNISKDWKEFKIREINLQVADGEYFVILGPTGAGKTLLLELIAGIWTPDSGKIYIDDVDSTKLPPEKRGIGFVYQDYMLFPHKNVFENIAFGLILRKYDKNEIKSKVRAIMELFNISTLAGRYPGTLSGGEQQRVALARALVIYPKILLLDEPLSAVDERLHDELIKEIKRIHRDFDITIIHVTHNFNEALRLADKIAIMNKGEILQVGSPEEIFRKPKSKFVANFVGVENLIKGFAEESDGLTKIRTKNLVIYSSTPKKGDVYLSIRPEDITISTEKVKTSARNVIKGRIKEVIDMGALLRLIIDSGEQFSVFMTRKSFFDLKINVGFDVWMYFKASAVHVF